MRFLIKKLKKTLNDTLDLNCKITDAGKRVW